jgi:hypothetical protein
MQEPIKTADQRVYLVLDMSRDSFSIEVLLHRSCNLFGMGQPKEIEQSRPPLILDNIRGDLQQQLEIVLLRLLKLARLPHSLREGTRSRYEKVQKGGLQTGVKLDEENRLVSSRLGIFRKGGQRNPEELLELCGAPLDETKGLNLLGPRARKGPHELMADRTGLSRDGVLARQGGYLSMRAFSSFPGLK